MKKLVEVDLMRIVAMLCIVIGHCFAFYGTWSTILDPYINSGLLNNIYKMVNPILIYAGLPFFVFISGYLFEYNWKKQISKGFLVFCMDKIKRLYIPAIIFSSMYYFLFHLPKFDLNVFLNLLVNGYGHLWFLYMLFILYMVAWLQYRYFYKSFNISFILSLLISLTYILFSSNLSGSFNVMFYYFFFNLGALCLKKKKYILNKINYPILIYSFVSVCLLLTRFMFRKIELNIDVSIEHWFFRLVLGVVGCICLFVFCYNYTNIISKKTICRYFLKRSFLLYLLHQFIIIFILNNVNIIPLYQTVSLIFPWLFSIIIIVLSLFASSLLIKIPLVNKYLGV